MGRGGRERKLPYAISLAHFDFICTVSVSVSVNVSAIVYLCSASCKQIILAEKKKQRRKEKREIEAHNINQKLLFT